jgi:hypothetical protein
MITINIVFKAHQTQQDFSNEEIRTYELQTRKQSGCFHMNMTKQASISYAKKNTIGKQ